MAIDTNFDGRSDVHEYYEGGVLVSRESDRNFDDRVDLVQQFDYTTHEQARAVEDVDYDGTADLLVLFQVGRPVFSKWAHRVAPAVASGSSVKCSAPNPEVVRRAADDPLTPLEDPFRTDLAVKAVRVVDRSSERVAVVTSGCLPVASREFVNRLASSSALELTGHRHAPSAVLDPHCQIVAIMRSIRGIQDLGLFRVVGQPNLNLVVDCKQAARHQINVADVQDAIQTAVGGSAFSQVLQGEQRYDLVMRDLPAYRDTKEAIERILLVSPTGERVALSQLCRVDVTDGANEIYREGNARYVAIKYSVRGRDLGSAVEEAIAKVRQQVTLPTGYRIDWAAEYESQQRSPMELDRIPSATSPSSSSGD